MRAVFSAVLLAAVALGAALPGPALAVKLVPPGNSAANQYVETLPGPGGNVPSSEANKNASPAEVLGKENAARLEALGPEGKAAAKLAAETAPPRGGKEGKGRRGAKAQLPQGSSGLSEVLKQATGASGSGGMGLLLPLVIAATVLGSLGYAIARRRSSV